MKIDREAETLGRTVVRWAGAGEKEKFLEALDALVAAEPQTRDRAVAIYVGVAALANRAVYGGGTPSEPQNQKLAEDLLKEYPWDLVGLRTLFNFLESVSAPEKAAPLENHEDLIAVFLVTGYIIIAYGRGLGHSDPYDFLDELVNTLAGMSG